MNIENLTEADCWLNLRHYLEGSDDVDGIYVSEVSADEQGVDITLADEEGFTRTFYARLGRLGPVE